MKKKDHPAYACWKAMLSRCRNSKNPSWKYCGGKGVKVCPQWLNFWQFVADMGPRPSMQHSLDRFPDGNGNYEPGNVRWATAAEQQNNTCKLRLIDGNAVNLSELCRRHGIASETVRSRLQKGVTLEQALTTPLNQKMSEKRRRQCES